MKYETLSTTTSGTYTAGQSVNMTLTFTNNIDHLIELYFKDGNNTSESFTISSYTISNNVLTVTLKCFQNITAYLFLMSTVASY